MQTCKIVAHSKINVKLYQTLGQLLFCFQTKAVQKHFLHWLPFKPNSFSTRDPVKIIFSLISAVLLEGGALLKLARGVVHVRNRINILVAPVMHCRWVSSEPVLIHMLNVLGVFLREGAELCVMLCTACSMCGYLLYSNMVLSNLLL